jgi:hypothetical protein
MNEYAVRPIGVSIPVVLVRARNRRQARKTVARLPGMNEAVTPEKGQKVFHCFRAVQTASGLPA